MIYAIENHFYFRIFIKIAKLKICYFILCSVRLVCLTVFVVCYLLKQCHYLIHLLKNYINQSVRRTDSVINSFIISLKKFLSDIFKSKVPNEIKVSPAKALYLLLNKLKSVSSKANFSIYFIIYNLRDLFFILP
jgi:hypothetical protein